MVSLSSITDKGGYRWTYCYGLQMQIKLLCCCYSETNLLKRTTVTEFTNTVVYSALYPINELIKQNQTTTTPSVDRKRRLAATGDN